jgi:RNA polymerase sigma factor (TIGR02999 family)
MTETITWHDVSALMSELRTMARDLLRLEGSAQSLTPTALVLTALRRQLPAGTEWQEVTWKDRAYFFGAMYRAMQRALIDHARSRNAKKRQAIRPLQVEDLRLDDLVATLRESPEQVGALLVALERLRQYKVEWAELVEHRYFAGYLIEETAQVMGVAEVTVRRWWACARVYLHDEVLRILNEEDVGEAP